MALGICENEVLVLGKALLLVGARFGIRERAEPEGSLPLLWALISAWLSTQEIFVEHEQKWLMINLSHLSVLHPFKYSRNSLCIMGF